MRNFSKLIIFCTILAVLPLACSKKSDKEQAPDSQKTIDLAESAPAEGAGKEADGVQGEAAPGQKQGAKAEQAKAGAQEAAPKKEQNLRQIARRNTMAALDQNGQALRGKPAAQVEAEAKQAAENPPSQDSEDFDFTQEPGAEPSQEPKTAPKRVQRSAVQSPGTKALSISHFTDIKEIREQTGYSGVIEVADLPGQSVSSRYNAMRWLAGKDQSLGLSLQVWMPGNESAASKRFQDLYEQSFSGAKVEGLASAAFSSQHHGLRELAFYDAKKRAVVSLACTQSLCSEEQLAELGRRIQKRL